MPSHSGPGNHSANTQAHDCPTKMTHNFRCVVEVETKKNNYSHEGQSTCREKCLEY